MSTNGLPRRPEGIVLAAAEQLRVLTQLRARRAACRSCGNEEFTVGDALYLGFLFRSEGPDAYMVALTCTNPDCAVRHTGIHLHRSQFLSNGSQNPDR